MKAMIAVLTTEDYQNRYNAAFHAVVNGLYSYHRAKASITDVVQMIRSALDIYGIEEFTIDDWDIITAIFAGYSWEKIK